MNVGKDGKYAKRAIFFKQFLLVRPYLKLHRNCLRAESGLRAVNWWHATNSRSTLWLKSPAPPMKFPIWFFLSRP